MSEVLQLLRDLVRLDTVAHDESSATDLCAATLGAAGIPSNRIEWEEDRDQLVARLPGGDVPLTLTGHLDTVPAHATGWSVDPWEGALDGDRLVGRGVSDMKSGVAAALLAVRDHAAHQHACRGIQLVLTAGEETGAHGASRIPASAMSSGGPLVVAEPTGNRIVPAHKGAYWLRLSASGRSAHGSTPELGDNAAVKIARAALAIDAIDDWPTDPAYGPVTANIGKLTSGVQPNVVPDAAELLLDLRTVPGVRSSELRDKVQDAVGPQITIDQLVDLPLVATDVSNPFVAMVSAVLQSCGGEPEPLPPARFFTDASVLSRALSAPATIVLGPGEADQCHVVDEWCSVTKLEHAVQIYTDLLARWCDGGSP